MPPDTAFVLCAGLGTRLRPLTDRIPKPLIPLQGRPLLDRILDHLATHGVREVVANTHHLPHAFTAFAASREGRLPRFTTIHEAERLETGGGLRHAAPLLPATSPFFLIAGDIWCPCDLGELARVHAEAGRPASTLLVRHHGPQVNVTIDASGRVLDLRDRLGIPGTGRVGYCGWAIIEPQQILPAIDPSAPESIVEAWLRILQAGKQTLQSHCDDSSPWSDIGTPEELESARRFFACADG